MKYKVYYHGFAKCGSFLPFRFETRKKIITAYSPKEAFDKFMKNKEKDDIVFEYLKTIGSDETYYLNNFIN